MNKILFENKVQVLERLILQDIIINYGMQKNSETSYDKLMAKLLDRITEFYEELEPDAISLQKLKPYGDRAKIYTEQLQADLDKAAEVTVRQIVKQLPREKLSGHSLQEVIQAVRPVLKRRMEVLSNLLSASALQMQNYMLLWDYQDAGFTHYCLLTEGENCDDCNNLEGQIFPISEARIGENFAPMHPNCNCRVGILNSVGQVAYIIGEGKSEKKGEETNWYDAFLRMPQDAKELFLAFVSSQNERLGQGDLAGFLDWLTMGMVSGTWQGYQDRWQELLNDPSLYNIANYLTLGFVDTVKGTINPEEPLSLQHWLDSLGVISTAFGAYQMGKFFKNTYKNNSTTKVATEMLEEPPEYKLQTETYNRATTKITSNLDNEIDITPMRHHITMAQNPGITGMPNSSVDIFDDNGNLLTRRWYDSRGRAYRDVDMTNHGNPKRHPEHPHEHFWDWSNDNPKRN